MSSEATGTTASGEFCYLPQVVVAASIHTEERGQLSAACASEDRDTWRLVAGGTALHAAPVDDEEEDDDADEDEFDDEDDADMDGEDGDSDDLNDDEEYDDEDDDDDEEEEDDES